MRGPETPDKVRASARKPAEREEHYREWRERHVEAEPWTRDEQEHRGAERRGEASCPNRVFHVVSNRVGVGLHQAP